MAVKGSVTFEDARLIFKNFSGKGTDYNPEGNRNFCVILDEAIAEKMTNDGWNVKTKNPKEGYEEDGPLHYIKVSVSYRFADRAPKIYRICGKNQVMLTEENVSSLDWDEIESVDLRIRPWNWERAGRKGVSAFLETMYVVVREDELAKKHAFNDDTAEEFEEGPLF